MGPDEGDEPAEPGETDQSRARAHDEPAGPNTDTDGVTGEPADDAPAPDTDATPENVQASLEAAAEASEMLTDTPAGPMRDSSNKQDDEHNQGRGWRGYLRATGWAGLVVCLLAVALIVANGGLPIVATVTSGSMAPNINQGDLVVLDTHSAVVPVIGSETEVVTAVTARERGEQSFNGYGSVIMFDTPEGETAILHRAHLRVEAGENWVPRANASYLGGKDCAGINYCPAPHDGIITKGDRNGEYDQVNGIAPPVRDDWIRGVARTQGIPFLIVATPAP